LSKKNPRDMALITLSKVKNAVKNRSAPSEIFTSRLSYGKSNMYVSVTSFILESTITIRMTVSKKKWLDNL